MPSTASEYVTRRVCRTQTSCSHQPTSASEPLKPGKGRVAKAEWGRGCFSRLHARLSSSGMARVSRRLEVRNGRWMGLRELNWKDEESKGNAALRKILNGRRMCAWTMFACGAWHWGRAGSLGTKAGKAKWTHNSSLHKSLLRKLSVW